MIEVTKLRNNVTFEQNGKPYRVVKYEHTHMSRGGGTVRIRARCLTDGTMANLAFKSTAYVNDIDVSRRELQYLYSDADGVYFMDPRSFEQLELPKKVTGTSEKYLQEGENVYVLFWDDPPSREASEGHSKILDLDLPPNMVYEVASCDPGERGNSVSNVYKPAKLKNGLAVKVPLFINQGDKVKVDTRTGEYVERVAG